MEGKVGLEGKGETDVSLTCGFCVDEMETGFPAWELCLRGLTLHLLKVETIDAC